MYGDIIEQLREQVKELKTKKEPVEPVLILNKAHQKMVEIARKEHGLEISYVPESS